MAQNGDRRFYIFNAVLSAAALGFLAWLLLIRSSEGTGLDLRFMPAVNACFNAAATALLVSGYVAIRRKHPEVHKYLMVSAFVCSALFLVGYITYHYAHGDTKYDGEGAIRLVYFAILISHVLLSMFILPLALTTFYLAWKKRFSAHRKVAKITLPIWLYVSVTGVVIFFMLHGG
ncbi:MAG: DUF420 domain-containing protein [Myxococcota bacterium]